MNNYYYNTYGNKKFGVNGTPQGVAAGALSLDDPNGFMLLPPEMRAQVGNGVNIRTAVQTNVQYNTTG